jgi:hypothetical protein
MEQIKHFFDLLDYTTYRAFQYALMVLGAIALIKWHRRSDGN